MYLDVTNCFKQTAKSPLFFVEETKQTSSHLLPMEGRNPNRNLRDLNLIGFRPPPGQGRVDIPPSACTPLSLSFLSFDVPVYFIHLAVLYGSSLRATLGKEKKKKKGEGSNAHSRGASETRLSLQACPTSASPFTPSPPPKGKKLKKKKN